MSATGKNTTYTYEILLTIPFPLDQAAAIATKPTTPSADPDMERGSGCLVMMEPPPIASAASARPHTRYGHSDGFFS